jgi:ankyrin repeat protein
MNTMVTLRFSFMCVLSCMQLFCFGMDQQLVVAKQHSTRFVKLPDERVEDIVILVGRKDCRDLCRTECLDRQWNKITNGVRMTKLFFPRYDSSLPLCTNGAKEYHGVNHALFYAIENGRHKEVSLLLRSEYADPNYKRKWTWTFGEDANDVIVTDLTPLSLASNKGDVRNMEALIKRGASVNLADFSNPVSSIIRANNSKVSMDTKKLCIQLLVEKKANMNCDLNPLISGRNFLHQATDNEAVDLIPLLVSSGVNVNQKNAQGQIPLARLLGHCCTTGSSNEVVKDAVVALIEAVSDLNAASNDGWSALSYTQDRLWFDNTGLAEIILEAAAKK